VARFHIATTLHHVRAAAVASHAARVGLEDVQRDQGVVDPALHGVLGGELRAAKAVAIATVKRIFKDRLVVGREFLVVSVCCVGGGVL
jgi:hypothetical protein